ncbi:MAG: auracyanin [Chloroflexi bacterium]|nr:auracyanin [Chloroflexota bacterium]
MDSDKRVTAGFSEFFPPPCETPPPPPDCQEPTLDISVNGDALEFDKGRFEVAAGSEVVLCFNNVSNISQHNWVLCKAGKKDLCAERGLEAGPDNGWVQPDDPDVIAHTRLLKPGQMGAVRFTAPLSGTYQFVCTFPGHNFTMFGNFVVTQ